MLPFGSSIFVIYIFSLLGSIFCWDLSSFGITNNHYISNIAVYHGRAFLALPKDVCENNVSAPSLVEVPWPELNAPLLTLRNQLLENQKWSDCNNLQNAVALNAESKKAKLWILDRGNEFCNAKILSYNLVLNIYEDSCEFEEVPKHGLSFIIIDPHPGANGLIRAYIASVEDSALLIVSIDDLKWWKLSLQEPKYPSLHITINYLAIAKTESIMYLTGELSEELFSLNLNDIQQNIDRLAAESQGAVISANISQLGNKLGISSGLETDLKNGLIYYLIRDYAVVRWISSKPLQAEYHNVLAQSYQKLPYVSQIFTDSHNNIWALVNTLNPEACSNEIGENKMLENRVVKILKYNIF